MRDVDKADIPPNGSRQDMTLEEIGFNSRKKMPWDREAKDDLVVFRAVIDNGDYQGKKVSFSVSLGAVAGDHRIQSLEEVTQNLVVPNAHAKKDFFRPWLRAKKRGDRIRFSASVKVNEVDEGVVKYDLTFFDEPEADADLHIKREPTQFKR